MVYLLDANVVIALTLEEHESHRRVSRWATSVDRIALCPIVEGAFLRFCVRLGESVRVAMQILTLLQSDPRCEFWADSLSYAGVDLGHVRGHRQVTDAYLAGLARSQSDGRLATLDRGLAQAASDVAFLVPAR